MDLTATVLLRPELECSQTQEAIAHHRNAVFGGVMVSHGLLQGFTLEELSLGSEVSTFVLNHRAHMKTARLKYRGNLAVAVQQNPPAAAPKTGAATRVWLLLK